MNRKSDDRGSTHAPLSLGTRTVRRVHHALNRVAQTPASTAFSTLVLFLALLSSLLLLGGQGAAVIGSGVIALQIWVGSFWWRVLRRGESLTLAEVIGVGFVLGSILYVFFGMLLREWLGAWGWLIPLFITASVSLFLRWRHAGPARVVQQMLGPLVGQVAIFALALALLTPFWLSHPVNWEGWWPYHADTVYHIGASQQVALFGPWEQPFVANTGQFRYHWFSNAWAGILSANIGGNVLFPVTRLLFVVSAFTSVLLAWSWASRVSRRALLPPFAAVFLVTASLVGVGAGYSNTLLLRAISPTHTFGIAVLLATSLVVLIYIFYSGSRWLLPVILILSATLMLTRITHAAVFAASMVVLAAFSWRIAQVQRRRVWLSTALCLTGFIFSYLVFNLGGSGSGSLSLQTEFVAVYGLMPGLGAIDPALGSLALVLSASVAWSGTLWLWVSRNRFTPVLRFWALGAVLAGISGVFLVANRGSEESFLWSASILLFVMSAIGTALAAHWLLRLDDFGGRRLIVVSAALGATAGVLQLLLVTSTADWTRFGGITRWLVPGGLWILAAGVGGAASIFASRAFRARVFLSGMIITLTAASAAQAPVSAYLQAHKQITSWSSETPLAWTREHVEAGEWLSQEASDSDVIATNRMCNTTQEPIDCPGAFPMVSALTGHRVYIEAAARGFSPADFDSMGNLPDWAVRRIENQTEFSTNPTFQTAEALWRDGVRWIWIDPRVENAGNWEPYAAVRFSNSSATIAALLDPRRLSASSP